MLRQANENCRVMQHFYAACRMLACRFPRTSMIKQLLQVMLAREEISTPLLNTLVARRFGILPN